MPVQLNIYFSGDPKSVDFRYYVQLTANKHLLNGTYQALPKNWFHVRIEGEQAEIQAFANNLLNGILRKYITAIHRVEKEPEHFNDFAMLARANELPDFLSMEEPSLQNKFRALFFRSWKQSEG